MRTCSHLLDIFSMEKFVHWFVQVHRQKTTLKKKTYFLKNHVASLFTFFEKVFAICKYFTTRCLDVRFWGLLYVICLNFSPQYWYLLLRREKMRWFNSYFWQGKGRNFGGTLQNRKRCLCVKYLTWFDHES